MQHRVPWKMPVLEIASTGKCRYWKLLVLEKASTKNAATGKCKYCSVANAKNFFDQILVLGSRLKQDIYSLRISICEKLTINEPYSQMFLMFGKLYGLLSFFYHLI